MTFIRFWIGFTMVGIATAILLLLWALRRRQFKESDRAGFLALADLPEGEVVPQARASRDTKVLAGVLVAGVLALAAAAIHSILTAGE